MAAAYIFIYDDESKDINALRADMTSLALSHGESIDNWIIECGEGKSHTFNRAHLDGLEGNSLYVEDIARLGSTLNDILAVLCTALRRGIRVYGVADGYSADGIEDTPTYIKTLEQIAVVNSRLKSSRTKVALAKKRRQGCTLGRPKGTAVKMSMLLYNRESIERALNSGIQKAEICRRFNVSPSTFLRYKRMVGNMELNH